MGKPGTAWTETARAGGEVIYAIGDVHGRYDLLKKLLFEIRTDIRRKFLKRRPILVFCGDYVDRGPQSAEVVQAVRWLMTREDFDVRPLRGNHEEAMLGFLDDPQKWRTWFEYGGLETALSYGIGVNIDAIDDGKYCVSIRNNLMDRIPASHLTFLRNLSLMEILGDYVFVHAGIRPGVDLADQVSEDLLWIREEFIPAPFDCDKIVVHGHTWINDRPAVYRYRIGIDTGAYETGVLTAARIDDHGVAIIQAVA